MYSLMPTNELLLMEPTSSKNKRRKTEFDESIRETTVYEDLCEIAKVYLMDYKEQAKKGLSKLIEKCQAASMVAELNPPLLMAYLQIAREIINEKPCKEMQWLSLASKTHASGQKTPLERPNYVTTVLPANRCYSKLLSLRMLGELWRTCPVDWDFISARVLHHQLITSGVNEDIQIESNQGLFPMILEDWQCPTDVSIDLLNVTNCKEVQSSSLLNCIMSKTHISYGLFMAGAMVEYMHGMEQRLSKEDLNNLSSVFEKTAVSIGYKRQSTMSHQEFIFNTASNCVQLTKALVAQAHQHRNHVQIVAGLILSGLTETLRHFVEFHDSLLKLVLDCCKRNRSIEHTVVGEVPCWLTNSGALGIGDELLELVDMLVNAQRDANDDSELPTSRFNESTNRAQELLISILNLAKYRCDWANAFSGKRSADANLEMQQTHCLHRIQLWYAKVRSFCIERIGSVLLRPETGFNLAIDYVDREQILKLSLQLDEVDGVGHLHQNKYLKMAIDNLSHRYDIIDFALKWLSDRGRTRNVHELLNYFSEKLNKNDGSIVDTSVNKSVKSFLDMNRKKSDITWLNNLLHGQFESASEILQEKANNETQFVGRKKTLHSLAKLCAMAKRTKVPTKQSSLFHEEENEDDEMAEWEKRAKAVVCPDDVSVENNTLSQKKIELQSFDCDIKACDTQLKLNGELLSDHTGLVAPMPLQPVIAFPELVDLRLRSLQLSTPPGNKPDAAVLESVVEEFIADLEMIEQRLNTTMLDNPSQLSVLKQAKINYFEEAIRRSGWKASSSPDLINECKKSFFHHLCKRIISDKKYHVSLPPLSELSDMCRKSSALNEGQVQYYVKAVYEILGKC